MTTKFQYAYKLTIGAVLNVKDLLGTGPDYESRGIPFKKQVDLNTYAQREETSSNKAFLFTEHQIQFSISKDDSSDPNDSTITLYNLSDNTVNYLDQNYENHVVVKLEAGYVNDQIKLLFLGTLQRMEDNFEGDTRKTTLYLTDGKSNIQEAYSSRSYPKGTSHNTIANDLVQDLGLPKGQVSNFNSMSKTLSARSFSGNTHQLLKEICVQNKHDYHIQDGTVNIIPTDKRLKKQCAYLTPDTGLIGSPSPLADPKQKAITKSSTSTTSSIDAKGNVTWHKAKKPRTYNLGGISFKCLLDGAITVGASVYIKSKNYDGAFKITKVQHDGDYEGNNWTTTCDAYAVESEV